ncbi:MAG: hypothetical protein PHV34_23175 [Verrucomicrobiae bacterium]|nr:hypothetical protein [Verrucomicrobiae bacterium]
MKESADDNSHPGENPPKQEELAPLPNRHLSERVWKPLSMVAKPLAAAEEQRLKHETRFFVALSGQDQYQEMPRSEIQRRLAAGDLRHTQPIWHPSEQAWKPARSFPNLLPEPMQAVVPLPKDANTPPVPSVPAAKSASPKTAVRKKVKQSDKGNTRAKAEAVTEKSRRGAPVSGAHKAGVTNAGGHKAGLAEIDRIMHANKLKQRLYAGLTVLLMVLLAAGNWLFVERTVREILAKSEYKDSVQGGGNYRFYVSPINVNIRFDRIASDMSGEKFIDMLTMLAEAYPAHPVLGFKFHSVTLSKNGKSLFMFHGDGWHELSKMRKQKVSAAERAKFMVDNLYLPGGKRAIGAESDNLWILSEQKQKLLNVFYEVMVKDAAPLEEPLHPAVKDDAKKRGPKAAGEK